MTAKSELASLEASLRRRFRVVESDVVIGRRTLSLLHPASAEDLINEADFDRDERLPYWAELWPSARVLAAEVARMRGRGKRALELGCGVGLVSTIASLAHFDVVASDYYEDATRFARVNAARNDAPPIGGMMIDWRDLPRSIGTFDLVFASDVLYERPYGPLVAEVIGTVLAPGGRAILADPGRVGREGFLESLGANGLTKRGQHAVAYRDGEIRQKIAIFEVAKPA